MTANLIRDGQTRQGCIAPVERCHEGLVFDYRPLMPEKFQVTEHLLAKYNRDDKPDQGLRLTCKVLSEHVETWSEDGSPPTLQNWLRMPYRLVQDAYAVISGYRASDPLPNAQEETERLERLLEQDSNNGLVEDLKN